jgi:hypothetical protein
MEDAFFIVVYFLPFGFVLGALVFVGLGAAFFGVAFVAILVMYLVPAKGVRPSPL